MSDMQSTVIVAPMVTEDAKPPQIDSRRPSLDHEDIAKLQKAVDVLWETASYDCDGTYQEREDGRCRCFTCQARIAIKNIEDVANPRLVSLHPERMRNPAERIYVEHWRKENERRPFLNHGYGLLELLLQPEGSKSVPEVSQRDAAVATSIIQWLGTNCGMGFVQSCERQIEKARVERREWFRDNGCSPDGWRENTTKGELFRAADEIAKSIYSEDKQSSAVAMLRQKIIEVVLSFLERYGSGGSSYSTKPTPESKKRLITLERPPPDLHSLVDAGRDVP